LGFENYFLRVHRDYLLSELRGAGDATRRTALAVIEHTPCDDDAVRRVILCLKHEEFSSEEDSMPFSVSPGSGVQPDEDHELASAMARAAQVLDEAGMSAQDLLDELPAAGEEVMRRIYGDALVDNLLRNHRSGVERQGT